MPWKPSDAKRHDRAAKTPRAERQWSDVANTVLKATGDEGRAVREANGVLMKRETAKFRGTASQARGYGAKRKVSTQHV